jgi:threonine dehydratase
LSRGTLVTPPDGLTIPSRGGYHRPIRVMPLSSSAPRRERRVSLDDVRDAARAIQGLAVRTPLVRVDPGRARPDRAVDLYLKLELLQPIGSFKIRGAANAVRQLAPGELAAGVWTVSAGNAAQGVALAARHAGAPCAVLVMDTAPLTKLSAIERLGARIVKAPYDECWRAVETHASDRMTGTFVHPFDHDAFIAGNGTAALEILEDLPDVSAIVAPVGGGGLIAGLGVVTRALAPEVRMVAVEPETAAPYHASVAAGRAVAFDRWRASFVDGAGAKSVLPSMFALLSRLVDDSLVVSLEEVTDAMRFAADRAHVIAEGAAGCAIAAALSGRAGTGKVVAVVSGGNIDLTKFASLVGGGPQPH